MICLKSARACTARPGSGFSWIVCSKALHMLTPVSSESLSSVSSVVFPIPRGGVFTTRSKAMESSGFCSSFRYEIMSLISARS